MPDITLYFLQASRAIRTAWLLEELNVPYNLEFSPREKGFGPQAWKDKIKKAGNPLGKSPFITDGNVKVGESGAIAEYLCETYDKEHKLLPKDPAKKYKAIEWIHMSEATFCLHALPILYLKAFAPQGAKDKEEIKAIEKGMSKNVQLDFDMLENALKESGGKFLMGDQLTVADTMMHFSAQFILERKFGIEDKTWPKVEQWVKDCEATDGYKKAVEKSGYSLKPMLEHPAFKNS